MGEKERDAARALAESALDRYAAGDYKAALARFQAAERIVHAPPHLLYMARCLANLGRLVEARDTYRKLQGEEPAADAPPAFHEAWSKGAEERAAVERRVAELRVEGRGPPAELFSSRLTGSDSSAMRKTWPGQSEPERNRMLAALTLRWKLWSLSEPASGHTRLDANAARFAHSVHAPWTRHGPCTHSPRNQGE